MEGMFRLQLLGTVQVEQDGKPIRGFRSRKALALLGYLAMQDQPVPREHLADLFWGDQPEARGRANLSWVLNRISALLPDCLQADRHTVQFQRTASYWLDLDAFAELEAQGDVASLAAAMELYRGEFLEGLYLDGCAEFEIWLVQERERWRQRVTRVLDKLITHYGQRGEYQESLGFARRLLALEPWREGTHQQAMRLLAYSGQRGAALAQYESCCRILAEELGVEPSEETTRLYEQIRDGKWRDGKDSRDVIVALPPFLTGEETIEIERPVFVARESELTQLQGFLDAALTGQGRVVFVTGDAGSGKTTLVQQFARDAQAAHPDLVVASGNCNAHTGVGDPYLPFRETLALLTGDVESRCAAGAMPREQARRLWHTLPLTAQALVEVGPDLVDTFLPGVALVKRATTCVPDGADWLSRLDELVQHPAAVSGSSHLQQSALFDQYAQVVEALASDNPLLLMLEDLQWADTGSASLLFHLGRRIEGSQVLVVGVFRPEEVASGRRSEQHPLEPVVNELQRHFGDIVVDLGQAAGQEFVEAFLDTEPNRLGDAFRETLYRQTKGHPLFTVELLRAMQARGDLIQDAQARWVVTPSLDWRTLPARVEAVIEARVGRLADELRDVLAVASVEGERFTAQVVARVQGIPERDVLQVLSRELENRHHLVRQEGEVQVGHRFLSHYRFAHALFQQYLYDGLSAGERRLLHGEIGVVLEEVYRDQTQEIAVQLAHHYAEAGDQEKAIEYSLHAGDQARLAYANQEAIDHYRRALAFLKEREEHERAARTVMKLGLTYHTAFDFQSARQAYNEGFALWQRAEKVQPTIPPSPAPHALRMVRGRPLTLDPTMADEINSIEVIHQLFSGLVETSPKMEAVPDVARSWEVSQGGQRYVFYLRDDVRWSDGVPVTAGDFAYAWRRVLDPATGSSNASLLYDIKGARPFHQGEVSDPDSVRVQTLDDLTLVVELEGPAGYFLHLLTDPATYPIPRHVVEARGETWAEMGVNSTESDIITNGPFRLEAWNRGESMTLARNPEYHGRFTGNLERVELFSLSLMGWSASLGMYEADNLDILRFESLPPAERDRARRRYAEEYVSVPEPNTFYVGFDVSRPPFDDPRVRRAFVLATDRETLVDVVLRGYEFPATGGLIPPGVPGHSARIGLPYDPEQARQLLAEAGYPGGRGFPAVDAVTWSRMKSQCEYLQGQWLENLGVEITWEIVGGVTEVILGREPPHVFQSGWTPDYPDPDACLRTHPVRRITRWRNDTYDRLVEKARRVLDQGERMKLYEQADKILIEDAAIMPITYSWSHFLVKPWVTRFPTSPSDMWFWKDVIIEPH